MKGTGLGWASSCLGGERIRAIPDISGFGYPLPLGACAPHGQEFVEDLKRVSLVLDLKEDRKRVSLVLDPSTGGNSKNLSFYLKRKTERGEKLGNHLLFNHDICFSFV